MSMHEVTAGPATARVPAVDSQPTRDADDIRRAEIRAWSKWKDNPARWEANMLAALGLDDTAREGES